MNRRILLQHLTALSLPGLTMARFSITPSHPRVRQIERAQQAWLQGDGQAFAALFTPDGNFIVPGQCWQGYSAILDAFQSFTATHIVTTIEIRNVVLQDDHAMVEWYWEDTEIQTGKVSRAEDAIAIDFQSLLIHRWREYIDDTSLKP